MIVDEYRRRVAIRVEEPSAAYTGSGVVRGHSPAGSAPGPGREVRVVVELSRLMGCMTMRALLGAVFLPDPSAQLTVVEVPFGADAGWDAVAGCSSELGHPLVAGLSRGFACAALDGLTAGPGGVPAGLVRVDRAAFDKESSEMAFRLAGRVLRHVLAPLAHGDPLPTAFLGVVPGW